MTHARKPEKDGDFYDLSRLRFLSQNSRDFSKNQKVIEILRRTGNFSHVPTTLIRTSEVGP